MPVIIPNMSELNKKYPHNIPTTSDKEGIPYMKTEILRLDGPILRRILPNSR